MTIKQFNSQKTDPFWISGGSPKILLRNRPTSCISESIMRPDNLPRSLPLPTNIGRMYLIVDVTEHLYTTNLIITKPRKLTFRIE